MVSVTKDEISAKLRELGLKTGDTVFIHASIKSFGRVDGGPQTVVQAILGVIGPQGTLAAPAFAFSHEITDNPVIDPVNDKSEMGSITDAVRMLPVAAHSIAYRHAVSAYGKNAAFICDTSEDVSPFDMNGSFGRLLKLDSSILLLGVAYTHCTCGHFVEFINEAPYRQVLLKPMRVVQKDGTLKQIMGVDFQPKPNEDGSYYHRPSDFNKAGALLEETGKVSVLPIGNAYCRLFKMRDYVNLVSDHFKKGRNVLYFEEGQAEGTPLKDGILAEDFYICGANREDHSMRSVVSRDDIFTSKPKT